MTLTPAVQATLAARFQTALDKLVVTHPTEAQALRNVLGAVRLGRVRGCQLTLAHRLTKLARPGAKSAT